MFNRTREKEKEKPWSLRSKLFVIIVITEKKVKVRSFLNMYLLHDKNAALQSSVHVNNAVKYKADFGVAHRVRYASCQSGVVYHLPVLCRANYIGATGSCINRIFRKRTNLGRTWTGLNTVTCVMECGCTIKFNKHKVSESVRDIERKTSCGT